MRPILVLVAAICLIPTHVRAVETNKRLSTAKVQNAPAPMPTAQERRCAYLGQMGSFHILGSGGTAAYRFANGAEHFAELRISPTTIRDPFWWQYDQLRSDTADPNITRWAFARQPQCGRWPVLMLRNGTWMLYEQTYGWGKGMGVSPVRTSVSPVIYSDTILSDEIPNISGTNAVKLLNEIKAAMKTKTVGLSVDDAFPSVVQDDRVEVTALPKAFGRVFLRHRIIATIEPGSNQISFEISSQAFADNTDFPIDRSQQEALFRNLKAAMTQQTRKSAATSDRSNPRLMRATGSVNGQNASRLPQRGHDS